MIGKLCRGFIIIVAVLCIPLRALAGDGEYLAAQAGKLGETHAETCGAARAMAYTASNLGEVEDARSRVIDMLKDYLANTPGAAAAWMVWQPDAFDGRDAEYADSPYHDSTGRFVPRAVNTQDGIAVQAAQGYGQPGSAYALAMTGGDYTGDPYYMESLPVYTVCVPVLRGGERVGAVGIEVDLSPWLASLQSGLQGSCFLMAGPDGIIPADADVAAMVSGKAADLPGDAAEGLSRLLEKGGTLELQLDTGEGDAVLNASAVRMGSGYWAVCSIVPSELQEGGVSSLIYLISGIVLFSVALIAWLYVAPRRGAEALADALEQAADGDADIVAPKYPGNNRHLLAAHSAFARNVRLQQQHRNHARSLAKGKYMYMHPASDKDATTTALNETASRMEGMEQRADELQHTLDEKQSGWDDHHRRLRLRLRDVDGRLERVSENIGQSRQAMVKAAKRIAQAGGQLAEARRQADELSPALGELNDRLAIAQKQHDSVRAALKALEEIALNSRIISLNAKVEAAHTDRPVFNALAQEMADMSKRCAQLHKQASELLEEQPENEPADASAMLAKLLEKLDGAGQSLEDIPSYESDDGSVQTLRQVREALQELSVDGSMLNGKASIIPEKSLDEGWWGKVSHYI